MPRTMAECADALAETYRLRRASAKVQKKIEKALDPFFRLPAAKSVALPRKISFRLGSVTFTALLQGSERSVTFRRDGGPTREGFELESDDAGWADDLLALAPVSAMSQNDYDQAVMGGLLKETQKVVDALKATPAVNMDTIDGKTLAVHSAEILADLTATPQQ